ncbi:MAG TPA: YbiU family protein, partial [Dongiaceae bacterium]|nr:YbiU family protein [Dongiaceae bacterium]
MSIDVTKLPELIRDKKREARLRIGDVEKVLGEIEADLRVEVDEIAGCRARGEAIIPELDYHLVREGKVPETVKAEIRRRGAAVVRNVFPQSQAEIWNEAVGHYLTRNDYVAKAATRDAGDRYFTSLKSSRPQIFGIYWSKPQMEARQ